MARLAQEAGRTVGVIGDRRGVAEGLILGTGGLPDVFTHPAAVQLHVLVLIPPTAIGTFDDEDQAFAFLGLVRIVIDANNVPQIVESNFLYVANAGSEDLEASAIRLRTQHGARVREEEALTFLAEHVCTFVANRPVNAAIGTET